MFMYLLAILIAFTVIIHKLRSSRPQSPSFLLAVGFIVIVTVLIAIAALYQHWIEWPWLWRFKDYFQLLAKIPLTEIVFGAGLGILAAYWIDRIIHGYELYERPTQPPIPAHRSQPDSFIKHEKWWIISLAALFLTGMLLPSIINRMREVTTVKTGSVEIQFSAASTIQNRVLFQVQRERVSLTTLLQVKEIKNKIELDNLFLNALDDSYINKIMPDESATTKSFETAKAKRDRRVAANNFTRDLYSATIFPFYECVTQVIEEGVDLNSVRNSTREVAEKLRLLLLRAVNGNTREFEDTYKNFIYTSASQQQRLKDLINCPMDLPIKSPTQGDGCTFIECLKYSPWSYVILANIMWFNENEEGARKVLQGVSERFKDDLNVMKYLGMLYSNSMNPEKKLALEFFKRALKNSKDYYEESKTIDNPDFKDRYLKASLSFKNALAYEYARLEDDEVPQLGLALKYAEEIYKEKPDEGAYVDTYGYVLMSMGARAIPPDFSSIECARQLFRKARSLAIDDYQKTKLRLEQLSILKDIETFQNHEQQAIQLLQNNTAGEVSCKTYERPD